MADNKGKKLFEEFAPVTTQEWEAKINVDLKGADYERKLVWNTTEGIRVKPYYRSEDLKDLSYLNSMPGEFPYARGNKKDNNSWDIRQDILVKDIASANKEALNALMKGATSVGFVINGKVKTANDLTQLLDGICLEAASVNFIAGSEAKEIATLLGENKEIKGAVDFDTIGNLTIKGEFYAEEAETFNQLKSLIETSVEKLPNYRVLNVNGQYFNNSGASIVQELAFALSSANEYLARLTDLGLSVDDISSKMQFTFGVGSNYFMEIAKVRAARVLWATTVKQYAPKSDEASKMFVHSVTSNWNKTIYDPYVNMLRTTTEAMSSAIAGVESMTVKPFDSSYRESDNFSDRIARNTQMLLKEEANFDKIVDPAAGSYYIENLTNSLAEEAWKLFVEIEEKGGFVQAFKDGFVQEIIKETAQKRDLNIATRRESFLGTNQFANIDETVNNDIDLSIAKPETVKEGKVAMPIRPYRGTEAFENLRLRTENHTSKPKVFLFTYGNLVFRKARAAFATNFFACAGYEMIDNFGFTTIEEGIKAVNDCKAEITVICSSDEEYAEIVPEIVEKLNGKTNLVLAGYPKNLIE